MRVLDIINESQGGLYRRGQEVEMGGKVQFANKDKQEIQLLGTQVLPADQSAYATSEELEQAYREYLADLNIAAEDMHVSGDVKKARAALVTVWHDVSNEKTIAYIKAVKAKAGPGKPAPVMWSNADFSRASGYGAQTKVAQRANLNLKPNSTITTNEWISVGDIASTVASHLQSRQDLEPALIEALPTLISNIQENNPAPVPGLAPSASSIEVDFGEVAAPVALVTGNFITGTGYKLAENVLLKPLGLNWQQLSAIQYPEAGNENLYDSYIQLDEDNMLKISSKDKKGGAAASVAGLVQEISKNPEKFKDINTNKKFKNSYELIKLIANPPPLYWHSKGPSYQEHGAGVAKRYDKKTKQEVDVQGNMGINGPLVLGVDHFGFITHDEAHMILKMIEHGLGVHPDKALKKKLITPNLHSLILIKGARNYEDPSYSLGWHLLAALAKKIANEVNKDASTDKFFKYILERSNMIQVKTSVKTTQASENDAVGGASFNQFTVIYPPVFEGKIELNADTNYMATRAPVSSGLAFKIP